MADFMSVNRGYVLDTVVIVFASLEITLVAARFYARRLSNAAIGLDDYFIVLALVRSPPLLVFYWSQWHFRYYAWACVQMPSLVRLRHPSNCLKSRELTETYLVVRVAHVGQHLAAVMVLPDGKEIIVRLLKVSFYFYETFSTADLR